MGGDGNTTIVALSCAWPPFSFLRDPWIVRFAEHWPDCPWQVIWAMETIRERPWGEFVAAVCRKIDTPVILLLLDDFLLSAPVDYAEILRCRIEMASRGAVYYRVQPTPECSKLFDHGKAGEHEYGEPYRQSLQPAFWDREYLLGQAAAADSPWDFELRHHGDPDALHCAVARDNRPISYLHCVRQGKWTAEAIAEFRREGWPMA